MSPKSAKTSSHFPRAQTPTPQHSREDARAQAKRRAKKAKDEKRTGAMEDEEKYIEILDAAEAWMPKLIAKSKTSDLQHHAGKLNTHRCSLPQKVQVLFTRKMAEDFLSHEQFDSWAETVWPCRAKPVLPPPVWTHVKPSFFPLALEYNDVTEDMLKPETSDYGEVPSEWLASMFNDPFLHYLDMADETPGPLEALLRNFLHKATSEEPPSYPMWLQESMIQALSCMRGLAVLIFPKPGIYGGSDQDVVWLRDTGGVAEPGLSQSELPGKTSIAKRMKQPAWARRYTDYDKVKGAQAAYAEVMHEMERTGTQAVQAIRDNNGSTMGLQEADKKLKWDFLEKWSDNIVNMRSSLRPGATNHLEQLTVTLMTWDIDESIALLQSQTSSLEVRQGALTVIDASKAILDIAASRPAQVLAQKAADMTRMWREKDKVQALEKLVVALPTTMCTQKVSELAIALELASSSKKSAEFYTAMKALLPTLYIQLVTDCCPAEPADLNKDHLAAHAKVLHLLSEDQAFCNVVGGKRAWLRLKNKVVHAATCVSELALAAKDLTQTLLSGSAPEAVCVDLLKMLEAAEQSPVDPKDMGPGEDASPELHTLPPFQEKFDAMIQASKDLFEQGSTQVNHCKLSEIREEMGALAKIAQGGKDGSSWAAHFSADTEGGILAHYSATLAQTNTLALETELMKKSKAWDPLAWQEWQPTAILLCTCVCVCVCVVLLVLLFPRVDMI